jgi:hypothetical protein
VVRGGAFINNERNVRCAVRNRNNPNNFNRNMGFRVVVAHDSFVLPEMPGGAGFPDEAPKTAGAARSWPHSSPHGHPLSSRQGTGTCTAGRGPESGE